MKIVLIIGLPGSGKTWLAEHVMATKHSVIVDDITDLDQLPMVARELIITDVNFCDAEILDQAEAKLRERYGEDVEFDRIFFENDATAARKNIAYRNDGRNVEGTIQRFAPIYQPPLWSVPIHDAFLENAKQE